LNNPLHQSLGSDTRPPTIGETTRPGWALRLLSIAIAIFFAAVLSQLLTTPPSDAAPVWPGAGIALAATILYGPRALIGVFLGVVAFEFQLFADTIGGRSIGSELIIAFGLGIGASMQALVGSILIRRATGPLPRLIRDSDILRFQLLGGPVACTVSASIGMAMLWSLDIVTTANLPVDWLTWWVSDTIGTIIFAPMVLIFFNHDDPLWRGRKTTVALPMLLLLLTAIAFYTYSKIKDEDEKALKFHDQTRVYHNSLMLEFQTHLELLDSLKSYFDTSTSVNKENFRIVNQTTLKNHADIQAVEWIPRISNEQRAEFERSLPNGISIHQLNSKGALQPAGIKSNYYAIQFIEPPDGNAPAFGFDVTSNPIAAAALYRARDSGRVVATAPTQLVQETANDVGIMVYNPVYKTPSPPDSLEQRRTSITGALAMVFCMHHLFDSELPFIKQGSIALLLLDVTEKGTPQLLYRSHGGAFGNLAHTLTESRLFDIAERHWRLEYTATPEFIAKNTTWAVWVVLTGGLSITALFGSGLLMLTGRTLQIEEEVIERTTELREEVAQRRDAETQLRLVLDGANLGFWDWNYKTDELWVNQRWMDILGIDRDALRNNISDWLTRIHPDDKTKTLNIINQHIRRDKGYVVDFRLRHQDGHWIWVQASGAVVSHDQDSKAPLRLCGTCQDITERRTQEEHILQQAHFDSLTKLPNRFLALDRLSQLIYEANRKDEIVGVLFLDLDDFKKVNDTLGHETGDKLLQKAASRLQSGVRRGDTVGRLGGDEFIVLLGGLSVATDASPVAKILLAKFNNAFKIDGRDLVLTASIGISVYPKDGKTLSELLRNADSAMYHSKELGRNTYSYFTGEMNQGVTKRLRLEKQMHGALKRGEFRLCYQAKVDLNSGLIVGAEALLRWFNPVLGEVKPYEFIPIAERTGLIVAIGKFVVTEALIMAAIWQHQLGHQFTLAVNLSPRQFRDPELVSFIGNAIRESGLRATALELEITEGVLMSGHTYIDDTLAALSELGVSIAMDDFGTGYSSLSYLRSYPFDVVKIDREFISEISEDPADRELVSAAIAMAHGLSLKVVAEGVETQAQLKYLVSLGCDYGQGYLFSTPAFSEEMTEILKHADYYARHLGKK
jgi:diguanylate cyclase (GGDEF)-like protein/PAS domain S-box-containing protein